MAFRSQLINLKIRKKLKALLFFRMINEGDNCIISYSIRNDEVYKMMTIKKNKVVKINKHEFKWDNCIGKPYGYVFFYIFEV